MLKLHSAHCCNGISSNRPGKLFSEKNFWQKIETYDPFSENNHSNTYRSTSIGNILGVVYGETGDGKICYTFEDIYGEWIAHDTPIS